MRVLVAEDDAVSGRLLESFLIRWGYQVVRTMNGEDAWNIFRQEDAPRLLIIDWMMPGLGGLDLCRRIRQVQSPSLSYIIILTARAAKQDIVEGLRAGADDYVTKPFEHTELQARINTGARILELQLNLTRRVAELEEALVNVKLLRGLLPICSYCKRIRDDQNYWTSVENYVSEHTEAVFSHGICPNCFEHVVKPELLKAPPATESGK